MSYKLLYMGSGSACQSCKRRRLCESLERFSDKDDIFDEDLLDIIVDQISEPEVFDRWKKQTTNKIQESQKKLLKYYERVLFPETVEQIQQFVRLGRNLNKRVYSSGLKHSRRIPEEFSDIFMIFLYPQKVVEGDFNDLNNFVDEIEKKKLYEQRNSIYLIEKVGRLGEKHLIKIGSGVSNEQLRRWCLKNNLQYQTNVMMVEANYSSLIESCGHGSGINHYPLSDYVFSIQFVNCKGEVQNINKRDHQSLMKSGAANLGFLGITVFLTIQVIDEKSAILSPRKGIDEKIIPRPGTRSEIFEMECNQTICEWFFVTQQKFIYVNNFEGVSKEKGEINPQFPPPVMVKMQESMMNMNNFLVENNLRKLAYMSMKMPYVFFPGSMNPFKKEIRLNYLDAVHFQRGVQNLNMKSFQFHFNVPKKQKQTIDYDLIQRIWWMSLEFTKKNIDLIDMALEMRIFKGSSCPLTPYYQYDNVCSIIFVRTATETQQLEEKWIQLIQNFWLISSGIEDSSGQKITIHPSWSKQWDKVRVIKEQIYKDSKLRGCFEEFWWDYQKIAKIGKWEDDEGMKMFSHDIYNNFFDFLQE